MKPSSVKRMWAKSGESQMTECPTCDRDGFKNEHGVKMHRVQVHDEFVAEKIECEWCGSEYR